jgi:hypothetical protein
MTFSGTALTLANDASISGLTVGKGGGAVTENTAVGYQALNLTGAGNVRNTAIGYQAGYSYTANRGTFVGYLAGYSTTGGNTTFIGESAGQATTTGTNNVALGTLSLTANTTGGSNTALGTQALNANTTASYNTAVGYQSLYSETTGGYATAIGYQSAYTYNSTSEANGSVFAGHQSGKLTTTGHDNAFIGGQAGLNNTTGSSNVALGSAALFFNTTASNNTAVGYQAGYSCTTNGYSVYLGYLSGQATTGIANTFVGFGSGSAITSGYRNTIIGTYTGNQGGLDIRTASNYIVLSDGDGNVGGYCNLGSSACIWTFGQGGTGGTNTGYVSINGSSGTGNGPFIRYLNNGSFLADAGDYANIVGGSTHQYAVRCGASGGVYLASSATSWSAVSDETRKDIIEPITGGLAKVATLRTVIGKLKTDEEGTRRPYLIAQDVQKVLPEAVSESEDKEGKVLGLSYTEVIPLLVNAIQELKAEFDAYKATHP